jgi:hypothetical protein
LKQAIFGIWPLSNAARTSFGFAIFRSPLWRKGTLPLVIG